MFAELLECDQDDFDTLNCLQSKDMVDVLMLSELNEVNQGRLKIWTSDLLSLKPLKVSLQKFQHSYNS